MVVQDAQKSLRSSYLAALSMSVHAPGKIDSAFKAGVCKAAASGGKDQISSIEGLSYVVGVSRIVGEKCSDESYEAMVGKLKGFVEAAGTVGEMHSLAHALQDLLALQQVGQQDVQGELEALLKKLAKCRRPSGGFTLGLDSNNPSIEATGKALEVLGLAKAAGVVVDAYTEDFAQSVTKVFDNQANNLNTSGMGVKGDVSRVHATAAFCIGASKLGLPGLNGAKAAQLALGLMLYKQASNLEEAALLLLGLQSLIKAAPGELLILSIPNQISTFGAGSQKLRVQAGTVFGGAPKEGITLTLVQAESKQDWKDLFETDKFSADATVPGDYLLDIPTDLGPGAYRLKVTAPYQDGELSAEGELKHMTTVSIPQVELALSDGKELGVLKDFKAHNPLVQLPYGIALEVSFKTDVGIEDSKPGQVALVATSQKQKSSAYFLGSGVSQFSMSISPEAISKQLGPVGGLYDIDLLVGGSMISNSVQWRLATANVSYQPTKAGEQPVEPLGPFQKAEYQRKKEIVHIHRPPEKRPSAIISLAFSGVVLIPLAWLAVFLSSYLKPNVKGIPPGMGQVYVFLFHGGIAATLVLYLYQWLFLNLLQTIPILAVVAVYLIATGYLALSSLAYHRAKSQ